MKGHTNGILAIAFTSDGKTLATGSADGTVRFWDVNSHEPISTFATGHTELVKSVAFSNDGNKVSIAHYNGTVEKWDIKSSTRLKIFNKFPQHLTYAVALSPDGSHLACHNIVGRSSFNSQGWQTIIEYLGNDITRIFKLDTVQELPHLTEAFGAIAFSKDNKILACKSSHDIVPWENTTDSEVGMHFNLTVGKSKDIFMSDVLTGTELFRFYFARRGRVLTQEGLHPNTPLLFSPNGSEFAVGPNVLSVGQWNPITEYGSDNYQIVAYSQDNTVVAIQDDKGVKKDIHLWDISTPTEPKKLNTINLPNIFGSRPVALSPNGTILIEATKIYFDTYCEANISLWDINTRKKLLSLPGHTEHIETLRFSPDGDMFASGSEDGTVILWDWYDILSKINMEN